MKKTLTGQKITAKQATKESYIPLQEFLLYDANYRKLSASAKLLYSFLRKKTTYFEKITEMNEQHGEGTRSYRDEKGYIFCIADNTEIEYILDSSEKTVIRMKKELAEFGLLEEVRVKDKANRLYVLDPDQLQERWEHLNEISKRRAEKKIANQLKAEKYGAKQIKIGNSQNDSYGNSQNDSYGNCKNDSKLKELNLSKLKSNKSKLKSNLSILEEVKKTQLSPGIKHVLEKRIDRLTVKQLQIIVELFEVYQNQLTDIAWHAVLTRVLNIQTKTNFRGLLETSLRNEIHTNNNEKSKNQDKRTEIVPDWLQKEKQEDESVGQAVSREPKENDENEQQRIEDERKRLNDMLAKYKRE